MLLTIDHFLLNPQEPLRLLHGLLLLFRGLLHLLKALLHLLRESLRLLKYSHPVDTKLRLFNDDNVHLVSLSHAIMNSVCIQLPAADFFLTTSGDGNRGTLDSDPPGESGWW